jgi:hypothetical protein
MQVSHREAGPQCHPRGPCQDRQQATREATGRGLDAAARAAIEATRQGHPVPSARELARTYHIGRDKAGEVRGMVLAQADGHGPPGQATT